MEPFRIVHRARQRPRHPHDRAVWTGDDLQIYSVFLVFSRVERAVGRNATDRDQRPIQHHVEQPVILRPSQRLGELGRAGRQELDHLVHIPPSGHGADLETGSEPGERLSVLQVRQRHQRLLPGGEHAALAADLLAMAA
jgi:hypothetical protein